MANDSGDLFISPGMPKRKTYCIAAEEEGSASFLINRIVCYDGAKKLLISSRCSCSKRVPGFRVLRQSALNDCRNSLVETGALFFRIREGIIYCKVTRIEGDRCSTMLNTTFDKANISSGKTHCLQYRIRIYSTEMRVKNEMVPADVHGSNRRL